MNKETIIKWNNINISIDSSSIELYQKISNGYYPLNNNTLNDFLFNKNNSESNDWLLLKVYEEVFNSINILLNKKYLIAMQNINIPNILNQAVINNSLFDLFIFLDIEISTYKKYSINNLKKFININSKNYLQHTIPIIYNI